MFSADDTIVAIATPHGRGGIGVIRISGPDATGIAHRILDRKTPLTPRHATLSHIVRDAAGRGGVVDQVLATYFRAPASYTGQDVVELSGHGSPVVLERIVRTAMDAGARLAEPGEFTLRGFLNGRIDLVQAEAIADLIDAVTPAQARMAFDQLEGTLTTAIGEIDAALFDLTARMEASLDFPEEGYHFIDPAMTAASVETIGQRVEALIEQGTRGRVIREGRQAAILGKPNTGKSTLFNYLVGSERAIVTAVPGTTRDLLTETIDLEGIPVRLVDTAGIREAHDVVESEGISRARQAVAVCDLALLVFDRSRPFDDEDRALLEETARIRRLLIVNKTDLPSVWPGSHLREWDQHNIVETSLKTHQGLTRLRDGMARELAAGEPLRDTGAISNVRHIELLERVRQALDRASEAAASGVSEEFVLADLREARVCLEEVTGRRTSEDLLHHIFERFCIGK